MDVLFEQRVVQNTGLAAETLWQAVHEAYETNNRIHGVPFPLVFLVLPLTFHQRTAKSLASRTQPGAIYKALADDREILVGLQARMQALSDRTLQALSIAFQAGLLRMDHENSRQLIPARRTTPVAHVTEDIKTIMKAAKRVGHAFSEMTFVQICTHLNVRF